MLHHGSTLLPIAQLDLLAPPPTLPGLPDPPTLQHALLENPVPPIILAVALALAAYAIAARLDKRRQGLLAAGVGLALGGVVFAVSTLVETKREQVIAATDQLVTAVATADANALDTLLDDSARLYVRGSRSGWEKQRVLTFIADSLGPGKVYAVTGHRVTETQAQIAPNGSLAHSRATVRVEPAVSGPTLFVCMLTWQEAAPGEWRVIEIDPLWVQGYGEISERTLEDRPRR